MSDNSVSLHRVLKAAPDKVFRAFTDADALAAWLPPYGFLCQVHEQNATVGGTYRMSFKNFTTGNEHSFHGKYLEIKQNEFLKYNDTFDNPALAGEMTTTVWIKKVPSGTELKVTQENIPSAIPIDGCYMGWQDSLDKLTRLVEPVIPDE